MINFLKIKKLNKGFTLIELLVVIAIIGILATMIMEIIGDATDRAEDAERLSTVRQMSSVLAREVAVGVDAPLKGCTTADADTTTCGDAADQRTIQTEFARMKDPEHDNVGDICALGVTGPCRFGISKADGSPGARTDNYQICFWLEVGAGGLNAGLNSIRNGVFHEGCQ